MQIQIYTLHMSSAVIGVIGIRARAALSSELLVPLITGAHCAHLATFAAHSFPLCVYSVTLTK
jgi:hypothetical protein